MKKFTFKYTARVGVLLSIILALCVAGLVWNGFILHALDKNDKLKIFINVLITLINVAILITVLSVMVHGRYVIKNDKLIVCFGFIKTTFLISDIVQITHFKQLNKLVVYFKSEEYSVIVISIEKYSDFSNKLKDVNPNIIITDNHGEESSNN